MDQRMALQPIVFEPAGSRPPGSYILPLTEGGGSPHSDAQAITEDLIRAVVDEFYKRARLDEQLGPVFERHVHSWETHLDRMTDFWSAALLRSGRYSGRPVDRHRLIQGLSEGHFARWIALFEATVRDLCPPAEADAFLTRALRMREAMTKVLGLREESRAAGESPVDSR